MTYSFNIRAATKAEAKQAVTEKFDSTVIAQQDCHKRDRDQALGAAHAFIDLLRDCESKDVIVSMSGSLSGSWSGSDVVEIAGANVSISAGLATKLPASA